MKSDVATEGEQMNNTEQNNGSSSASDKKKYIIIAAVAGGVILIVAIVLIVVFVTKSDDSSSSSEVTIEPLSWDEAYKKAEEAMKKLDNTDKFNLLFGIDNLVHMWEGVCVGMIEANKKIDGFRGMCLQDGPAGVRTAPSTTSWQAQINTASTFNRTLWHEYGRAYGYDFRKKGINVALGPAMNILRTPIAGRIWESYSEDPYLSGEAATYIIKAIQSTGVMACAKHYVGNDQETNRKNSTSDIPEQALWEIYIEPFYRSVKDGDVGSFMSSYNDVNGTLLSKNKKLIQEYLKDKIGFKGFVMSDWWAIKDNSVENFNSGEDMNMPGGAYENNAYEGRDKSFWSDYVNKIGSDITQARLDDAVKRVLASMYKFKQIKSGYPDIDLSADTLRAKSKKINREAAAQSNVLLKNNDVLPLSKDKYSKIAIIGNDAFASDCNAISDCSCVKDGNAIFKGHLGLGYGSGTTTFKYIVAPFDAISERAKKLGINIVSAGKEISQQDLSESYGTVTFPTGPDYLWNGAQRLSNWNTGNLNFPQSEVDGKITTTNNKIYIYAEGNGNEDLQVAYNTSGYVPIEYSSGQKNYWSQRDTNGVITVTFSDTVISKIQESGFAIYGNGVTVRAVSLTSTNMDQLKNLEKAISFTVGVEKIDEAEKLADENSDIKLFIVFIMADSGEQYITLENSVGDRQDMNAWHKGNELVEAIVAKRKSGQKILVVINAPGPINVEWRNDVDAIIFSGMGGSESGNGLTDVLFGDVNPSGHLPYVWGKIDQYPAQFDIFSNPTQYIYSEGVFVGQRWFDKKGYTPIFPFGFGLSYTTFSYSDLQVSYSSNTLVAKFKVQNTGGVNGDAVPMLFLKFPDEIKPKCEHKDYPSKLFKGFDKVFIKKGETKEVTINVDDHSLSYYSISDKDFVKATGTFTVYVGENARDLPLSKDINIS